METHLSEQRMQSLLQQLHAKTGIPGLSASISVGGARTTAVAGANSSDGSIPMSPDSRFQLGCITKLLTSLIAMELSHSGALNLDAPIGEYLPELAGVQKSRDIRLRHLGSHTSGYQGLNLADPHSAYFYSWEKFTALFRETPQIFTPGTVFNYEHTECVLLGEIVRRVTQSEPAQLVAELILKPLQLTIGSLKADMSDPRFRVADHAPQGESGQFKELRSVAYCGFWAASLSDLTISTLDLVRLGEALAGLAECSLGKRTVENVRAPLMMLPRQTGGPRCEQMPLSFGFGCANYAGGWFGHNGSARGQTCGFRFDPARKRVIVVALNAWQPHIRDFLINQIARDVAPSQPAGPSALSEEDWSFSDIEGSYVSCVQGVSLVAQGQDDQLVCKISNSSTKATAELTLSRNPQGVIAVHSNASHLSAGLFRDPTTGAPCFMIGLNAFRKA